MKKSVFLLAVTLFIQSVCFAGSVNNALYQTMRASSYRNNYNRQVNYKPIPYWQAQSNFATRNRTYQGYSNYNNSLYQYNSAVRYNRSYR